MIDGKHLVANCVGSRKRDLGIYKVCRDMTLLEQGEGGKGRNIHDIQQSQLHLVMLYI